MSNLASELKIDQVLGYYAAGTTKRTSDIIDMANYEGVIFIAELGTIINGGTLDVYVEQNTANSTSGMSTLTGTSAHTVTTTNASLSQSCIVVDVYKPRERYLQCNITPASQNAVILGITAIRYNGRNKPDASPTALKTTVLNSPSE